jgi:hypothetical protein
VAQMLASVAAYRHSLQARGGKQPSGSPVTRSAILSPEQHDKST